MAFFSVVFSDYYPIIIFARHATRPIVENLACSSRLFLCSGLFALWKHLMFASWHTVYICSALSVTILLSSALMFFITHGCLRQILLHVNFSSIFLILLQLIIITTACDENVFDMNNWSHCGLGQIFSTG